MLAYQSAREQATARCRVVCRNLGRVRCDRERHRGAGELARRGRRAVEQGVCEEARERRQLLEIRHPALADPFHEELVKAAGREPERELGQLRELRLVNACVGVQVAIQLREATMDLRAELEGARPGG